MVTWAGLPIEVFLRFLVPPEMRNEDEVPPADLTEQVAVLPRSRGDLTDAAIGDIEQAFATEYSRLREDA